MQRKRERRRERRREGEGETANNAKANGQSEMGRRSLNSKEGMDGRDANGRTDVWRYGGGRLRRGEGERNVTDQGKRARHRSDEGLGQFFHKNSKFPFPLYIHFFAILQERRNGESD